MIRIYDPRDIESANAKKRSYRTILATSSHAPIETLAQLRREYEVCMGLFSNGIYVGKGSLCKERKNSKWLHTEYVYLGDKFRRKGHGLPLYLGLIRHARRLGATRLYSASGLNKYSKRMWEEKLAKLFDVRSNGCAHPCKHCKKRKKFYINL